mmetsp:Transcript_783/g.2791  ORF Transcript_783/g.2791 Transcript_783/m.2791 type:complete len:126 (-) Transcript_783:207-584(-)
MEQSLGSQACDPTDVEGVEVDPRLSIQTPARRRCHEAAAAPESRAIGAMAIVGPWATSVVDPAPMWHPDIHASARRECQLAFVEASASEAAALAVFSAQSSARRDIQDSLSLGELAASSEDVMAL